MPTSIPILPRVTMVYYDMPVSPASGHSVHRWVKAPFDLVRTPQAGDSGDVVMALRPVPLPDIKAILASTADIDEDLGPYAVRNGDEYIGDEITLNEHEMGAWNGMTDDGPVWGLHRFGWV